jgi:signal transduction histidine kinase
LLVDDNQANLIALAAVLKPLHVRMVEARSGAEAISCVEREPFAVVLLDVQMPEMDGFETARHLRTLKNGREVPILFVTAIHREEAYAKRGYAEGAADYITKPYDAEVLRARVRAFASLYRQREEIHRDRAEQQTRKLGEVERRLDAFERISTAALETDDVSAFLHTLLTVFLGAADAAETATILLRYGSELRAQASIGFAEEVEKGWVVPVGIGFSGLIAASGHPLLLTGDDISRLVESDWIRSRGLRALFGAPLVADGHVIGVAHIGSSRADAFSTPERRLFNAMVERAAWAVSRRRARGRVLSVLDAAPAFLSVWRPPEYRCEFANNGFRRLHGNREVIGVQASELGMDAEMLESFNRVHRDGDTVTFEERPQGDLFVNVSLHPLRNAIGDVDAVLAFAVDVTANVLGRRKLEAVEKERESFLELERAARKEAEIANQAKDQFLATVSHELRTPLNAILGWSSNARRGASPQVERALGIIERNARAQTRIIDDVLDLSRIISGKLRLEIIPTDVSNAIFSAVEVIRPTADAKQLALSVHVDDDLGIIAADADRIQQVVWNLLSNAVKFTPQGGRVELQARRVGSEIRIVVSDTGQGISPEFLSNVFEPFRQADGSTTRRHGGLGLGLAIVKQLVHAHGGDIHAESPGEGHGATFTVKLPSRSGPKAAELQRASNGVHHDDELARLDGLRVLVLDDEEDARQLVEELLGVQGAIVEAAASAEEAIDKVRSFRPDVLVSDIGMPHTDGYAFIRKVRELPSELGGRTPAIALTAYARSEDSERAVDAGFQVHVRKPFEPSDLVRTVARLRTRRASTPAPARENA